MPGTPSRRKSGDHSFEPKSPQSHPLRGPPARSSSKGSCSSGTTSGEMGPMWLSALPELQADVRYRLTFIVVHSRAREIARAVIGSEAATQCSIEANMSLAVSKVPSLESLDVSICLPPDLAPNGTADVTLDPNVLSLAVDSFTKAPRMSQRRMQAVLDTFGDVDAYLTAPASSNGSSLDEAAREALGLKGASSPSASSASEPQAIQARFPTLERDRCLCKVDLKVWAQHAGQEPCADVGLSGDFREDNESDIGGAAEFVRLAFVPIQSFTHEVPTCANRNEALGNVVLFPLILDASQGKQRRDAFQDQLRRLQQVTQEVRIRTMHRPEFRPRRVVVLFVENSQPPLNGVDPPASTPEEKEAIAIRKQAEAKLAAWEAEYGLLWKIGPVSILNSSDVYGKCREIASALLARAFLDKRSVHSVKLMDSWGGGIEDAASCRSGRSFAYASESFSSEGVAAHLVDGQKTKTDPKVNGSAQGATSSWTEKNSWTKLRKRLSGFPLTGSG